MWYEKNYEIDFDDMIEESALQETTEDVLAAKDVWITKTCVSKNRRNVASTDQSLQDGHQGIVFPRDIWFHLSKHIDPEDVWRFACLCRDACAVTNTVTFWRSLYKRYMNHNVKMPPALCPELIHGTHGVRYVTICALYRMYEPFQRLTAIHAPCEGNASPYSLKKQICKYTWTQSKPGVECTCFILFEENDSHTKTPVQFNSDIYANTEKNQTILRVFCRSFQNLPQADMMGRELSEVYFNVSSDMIHHKLRLVFQNKSEDVRLRQRVYGSQVTAVLDPVIRVQVLHWWHPLFRKCKQAK